VADETLDDIVSDLLPVTLVLIKERCVREASTTGIPLMEICNKLLFAIVKMH